MIRRLLIANKRWILPLLENAQVASLVSATREQGLDDLFRRLSEIVPDLRDQFTTFSIDSAASRVKTRSQHAFQMKLILNAVELVLNERNNGSGNKSTFRVVDIGDSSGTHSLYLKSIFAEYQAQYGVEFESLSVNLDPVAVEKIRSKGLKALMCRAEDLHQVEGLKVDLFISLEMVEHLSDPVSFLNSISKRSKCEYLALTVPYLKQSRVGLDHIRNQNHIDVYPENTHIFELSPADWTLIFNHAGWEVRDQMIYRQYPRHSFWRMMKSYWKRFDYEGFYGVILKRNRIWSERYKDATFSE